MARILVVDDELGPRESHRYILKPDGHEVLTACGVSEALEKLSMGGVDLVITGIMMPRVTGIELIEEIQKTYPKVKVIVVAGSFGISRFNTATSSKQGFGLGTVVGCLQKPFDPDKLRDLVQETLGAQKKEAQRLGGAVKKQLFSATDVDLLAAIRPMG